MPENKDTVSKMEHQTALMHYNWVNRRSMISLICVCITMIIVVFIFATNQTRREQMWQETIKELYNSKITEVQHETGTEQR